MLCVVAKHTSHALYSGNYVDQGNNDGLAINIKYVRNNALCSCQTHRELYALYFAEHTHRIVLYIFEHTHTEL